MCAECLMLLQLIAFFVTGAYGGSCRDAALCCNGRDSACVVQKVPPNAITSDFNVKPCYCDHACLKLGDCCGDFKAYCGVIDCVVSEWSRWSECDAVCGPGTSSRTRTIRQQVHNGGKHCPSLVQKRDCQGSSCRTANTLRLLGETAKLLPVATLPLLNRVEIGSAISPRVERELLNSHSTFNHNRVDGYCIAFEIMKVSKHCQEVPDYRTLTEGDRVVVRCASSLSTTNVTPIDDELYNSSISSEHDNDDGDGDDDNYNQSTEYDTSTSNTIRAVQQPVSHRCLGEGLTGRNTRFTALTMPLCHGKWLRLTVGLPKKCKPSESQFVFV
ncbi:somatomedin-B and thrombospondin type-1 domain-containing protein-like isoform X1 [Topomyia yanbarensis]|uniref:somatomedin-B and thrombospondin type-1 domain-containing protein-like isoform X1 n=1 Tax=Topomyia yanbarensis TaxID=2498891 RepID=UPI00273CA1BE|nr:somatomedin-B and thrombospondin type-1 domain-containing protein-like isoform X1 [Topomyia yanbarensis]